MAKHYSHGAGRTRSATANSTWTALWLKSKVVRVRDKTRTTAWTACRESGRLISKLSTIVQQWKARVRSTQILALTWNTAAALIARVHQRLGIVTELLCSQTTDKMIFVLEKLHAAGKQAGQKRDHQWLDGETGSGKTTDSSPSSSAHSPDHVASDPLQPPLKRSSGSTRKPSGRKAFAPTSLPLATSELGGFSWAGDPTFQAMPSNQPVASPSQSTLPADAQMSTQVGTLTSSVPAAPGAGAVDPLLASQLAFQNLIDPRGEVDWNTAILPSASSQPPVSSQSFAGIAPNAPSPFGHQSFQLDFGAPADANGYYPLLAQTGRPAQPPDQVVGHFGSTGGLRHGSVGTQQLQQQQAQPSFPASPFDPTMFGNAGFDWTAFGAAGDWRH